MVIIDEIIKETFTILNSPLELIAITVGVGIAITIVGWIFSIIFKKYSFFGFPLSETPGCWYAAVIFWAFIEILNILNGGSLLYNVRFVIGTVIALLILNFVNFIEQHQHT